MISLFFTNWTKRNIKEVEKEALEVIRHIDKDSFWNGEN